MELIPASFGTPFTAEAISCLSVSPNKRFIAVAEKSDRGVVSIYDSSTLRRRKVLNYAELESKEIIHICFSQDNKLCLTQGGAPDYSLVLWNVEKAVKGKSLVTEVSLGFAFHSNLI
jgi:WD40 repeat protein